MDIGILARETDVLVEIVVQSDLILRALLLGSLRGLVHVVASFGVTLLLDDRRDDERIDTLRLVAVAGERDVLGRSVVGVDHRLGKGVARGVDIL